MANLYGDIELDAVGMGVLAHPVRLAILTRLQRHGPATATLLAPEVGATPSVTSWHLRHLAKHDLVPDAEAASSSGRERWWQAAGRGFRFTGGGEAARALTQVKDEVEGDVVARWRAEVEPTLEREWQEAAGRSNTRILVMADELLDLEAAIQRLLAPYVLRKDAVGSAKETGTTGPLWRDGRFSHYWAGPAVSPLGDRVSELALAPHRGDDAPRERPRRGAPHRRGLGRTRSLSARRGLGRPPRAHAPPRRSGAASRSCGCCGRRS